MRGTDWVRVFGRILPYFVQELPLGGAKSLGPQFWMMGGGRVHRPGWFQANAPCV